MKEDEKVRMAASACPGSIAEGEIGTLFNIRKSVFRLIVASCPVLAPEEESESIGVKVSKVRTRSGISVTCEVPNKYIGRRSYKYVYDAMSILALKSYGDKSAEAVVYCIIILIYSTCFDIKFVKYAWNLFHHMYYMFNYSSVKY